MVSGTEGNAEEDEDEGEKKEKRKEKVHYEQVSTTGRDYREQKAARVITRAIRAFAYWRALQRAKAASQQRQGSCRSSVESSDRETSTIGLLVAKARGRAGPRLSVAKAEQFLSKHLSFGKFSVRATHQRQRAPSIISPLL